MNKKKGIFVTCHNIFSEIQSGGEQCALRNYQLLCDIYGQNNIIVCIISGNIACPNTKGTSFKGTTNNLEMLIAAFCNTNLYLPKEEKKIIKFIESCEHDFLFMDSSLFGRLARHFKNDKQILFLHNIEYLYALNKFKNGGVKYLPQVITYRANEKMSVKYANAILTLNSRDNTDLFSIYKKSADETLPITFNDNFDEQMCKKISSYGKKSNRQLLFVGSSFMPNLNGIMWFIENVMKKMPNFYLTIVGKGFEEKRKTLQRSNVCVIGTVNNLEEYYYKFSIVVMPIFIGSGMKVKTAEAMMYGRTILATDEAMEGYEDTTSIHGIYRCNNANDFIQTLTSLSEEILPTYQEGVREYFIQNHESQKQKAKIKALIDRI